MAQELARFDAAALAPLASAAAHTDLAVAGPARDEIDRLIRRWKNLEQQQTRFDASGRRLMLARELRKQARVYTPSGRRWLSRVTERLLSTAPTSERGDYDLIAACDDLIAISRQRSDIQDQLPPQPPQVAWSPTEPQAVPADQAQQSDPVPGNNGTASNWRSPNAVTMRQPSPVPQPPPQPAEPEPIGQDSQLLVVGPIDEPPTTGEPAEPARLVPPMAQQIAPEANASGDLPWQSANQPAPTVAGPAGLPRQKIPPDAAGGWSQGMLAFACLSDRQLLAAGLAADDQLVRAMLINRGFGGSSREQLAALISESEPQRLALVDRLLVSSTGNAARLLLTLGSDESPRVRAAALGALASSRDPRLVDAAWRMAIRDPDPRVGRLANELRR